MHTPEYYLSQLDALESDYDVLSLIKRIQIDAWRQGMTDGANISHRIEFDSTNSIRHLPGGLGPFRIEVEITQIRDSTTEFPYENSF